MKAYPEYKESNVEWIGKIPTHWNMRKISRSFNLIGSGTTPKSDQPEYYSNGTISWVITGDLNDGLLEASSKKITQKAFDDHSTLKLYPPGTLLIAMYGATIGKISILGFEGCTNQACCAIADSPFIDTNFAFYWFLASKHHIINLGYGGGQPNISQDIIRSLRISSPPLPEQQAIVEFLDHKTSQIDPLITKKQRQIELLQEYRIALINQTVTKGLNPEVPMKYSGIPVIGNIPVHWEVRQNKRIYREVNEKTESGEEELLTVSHISGITHRSEKDVNMFMAESLVGYKLCQPGDLLVNTMWAWMGALGISPYFGVVSPSYNVYRLTTDFYAKFLDYLYRTPAYIVEINRYSKGIWTSRLRLYPDYFFQMSTLIPPMKEQEAILKFLNSKTKQIDTLLRKLETQISYYKEYRTALISAAVTGKIDVRNEK